MNKDQVSVVVPNYNGKQYIEICVEALRGQLPMSRIILVDNGSSDGSIELIREQYADLTLISLDKNYGFCRAVNEGIKAADTEYVILLNNDTKVFPHFVEELVKAMEKRPKAFSAGAKMIQYHDKSRLDDAGNFYCALGWAFARGKDADVNLYEEETEVFAACGGAAIYRREVFEKIGLFDEAHFAYLEDIDVGYRAKLFGYKNYYIPSAKVYHVGSASSGSRYNEFKVTYSSQNSIYLVYKNMPILQIVLNSPFLLAGFFVKYLFFVKKGLGSTYRKGLKEGLKKCRPEKKVPFRITHLPNYLKVQWELWVNVIRRFR